MFGTQAQRLLREDPWDAQSLAEELFAMFSSDSIPLFHAGPITLTPPPDYTGPLLIFRGFPDGQEIIRFERPDDPDITINGGSIGLGTGYITRQPNNPAPPFLGGGDPYVDSTSIGEQGGGSGGGGGGGGTTSTGFAGVIAGQVSGGEYNVTLTTGESVQATVGQIAAGEVIPVGTFVVGVIVGSDYYFQVPVWL